MKHFIANIVMVIGLGLLLTGCSATTEPSSVEPEKEYVYITVTSAPEKEYITVTSAPEKEYVYVTVTQAPEREYVYVTVTSAPEKEYVYVTVTQAPEKEYVYVTVTPTPKTDYLVSRSYSYRTDGKASQSSLTKEYLNGYYEMLMISMPTSDGMHDQYSFVSLKEESPYYVGKESTSYLASVEGKYDVAVYLDMPFNMASKYNLDGYYSFSVSDTSVGSVEKGVFTAKKQGLVSVTICDAEGKTVKTVRIACTTYNDGRSAEYNFARTGIGNYTTNLLSSYCALQDAENARLSVNSVDEMVCYLIGSYWCYRDHRPAVLYTERWMYSQYGKTNVEINTGVCTDVASAACYLLQNNYEDWGFILIKGKYGHIINWFYEDGRYIIVDFTEVISSNPYCEYMQYRSGYIHEFATTDEIAAYLKDHYSYINDDDTVLVYMYSTLGHDYQNADFDPQTGTGMPENFEGEIVFGIEDVEYDTMTILFQSSKATGLKIIRVTDDDQPWAILSGEHTQYSNTKLKLYWNY